MQDTADYLPGLSTIPRFSTGATQKTNQYTISSYYIQKSWWDRQQSVAPSQIPWWHGCWSTFPRRIWPRSSKRRSRSWPKHSLHRDLTMHFKVPKKPAVLKQLGLPGYQYTRGWGLQSSKKEGSPFRMFSRTDRTRTAKQQVLRPEIPTDKEESPSHLRRRLVLTHCGREDLWKWTIFNTILTSPKSWLSQEDLDAGFEHSLMPTDS